MSSSISLIKFNTSRHFILTRPARLDDLDLDDLPGVSEATWREKSRQLQIRRWRKLRSLGA